MIQGIGEIFCTPGGAQGVPQDADIGGSEGANYNSELCSFLVPIFQKQVGDCHEIIFCKHLGPRVGAGAGTGADTGTYTVCPTEFPPLSNWYMVT